MKWFIFAGTLDELRAPDQSRSLGLQLEIAMDAVARTVSHVSGTQVDVERLLTVIICGIVLIASLLLVSRSAHLGLAPSPIGLNLMTWI